MASCKPDSSGHEGSHPDLGLSAGGLTTGSDKNP